MPDSPHADSPSDPFQLSLDDMLERVSASTRADQEARSAADAVPAKRAPRSPIPRPEGVGSASPAAPRRGRMAHVVAWPLVALMAVGIAVISAHRWQRVDERAAVRYDNLPPPAAGHAPARPIAPPAASQRTPSTGIAVDADASTESLMLKELDQAGGDVRVAAHTAEPGAPPDLAIVRYDMLHTLPANWRVVAPLNVEAIYALVPAASRLRNLRDLRGRRINVGAPGSARATSGEALYRALFAQPLPASPLRAASKDAALPALASGGLDAVLVLDGQPSAWLEALPAETRRRLRVLRFDSTGVAERRAVQAYLPASIAPALANDGEAVPTLGEVAFLVASAPATRPRQVLERLCEQLPRLRATGHPGWKQVDPSLQLPVSLQRIPALDPTLQACRASTPANSPILSLSGARP